MTSQHSTLFDLIRIFRSTATKAVKLAITSCHCAHHQLHDYYCDADLDQK